MAVFPREPWNPGPVFVTTMCILVYLAKIIDSGALKALISLQFLPHEFYWTREVFK